MIIRAWQPGDESAVAALIATVWGAKSTNAVLFAVHGADQEGPSTFRRTLLAETAGQIIGVCTLWEQDLHPWRWRVTMHVLPQHRRQGTGSLLLTVLRSMRPDNRPLQTATFATDRDGCHFFKRHGFRLIMRTRRGVIDPALLPAPVTAAMAAARERAAAAGFTIRPLPVAGADVAAAGGGGVLTATLARRALSEGTLAHLHALIYQHHHAWDPVKPLADAEAAGIFLAPDDLLPDAMYVAFAGETPVGVASLRPHAAPGLAELGWIGVLPEYTAQADDLTLALLEACLARARAAGWEIVVEVDEAHSRLWSWLEQVPVALEPEWLTFSDYTVAE